MSNKKNSPINLIASLLFFAALFFFILTFSIALPIYCRPFYYAHIDALSLSEQSGFTEYQIKESYDDVLDYLTHKDREFSAGVMKFSGEGAQHFKDCKSLFDLNASVLILSALILIVLLVLQKAGKLSPFMLGKHSSAFYSAVCAVGIPLIVGLAASLDFEKAFTVFHKVFFHEKTNWIFYPEKDQIIRVLPQKFFMNYAILIGASILTFSLILILCELRRKKHNNL